MSRIIKEVTDACLTCTSLKHLPTELLSQSAQLNDVLGSHFSADVIRRENQKILLIREKLSQFTITTFIPDETAQALGEAIFCNVVDLIPDSGATIQVDNAPGFQSLQKEHQLEGSLLLKHGITVDLGRVLNKNKNPVAENGIKEFLKECLRANPSGGPLTGMQLAMVTKVMNGRVRNRGYSSKEILLQRDQSSLEPKILSDAQLGVDQFDKRQAAHSKPSDKDHNSELLVGQNVMLREGKSKTKGRELFKVIKLYMKDDELWATVLKAESQLRAKEYEVKSSELIPIPGLTPNEPPTDPSLDEMYPNVEQDKFIADKDTKLHLGHEHEEPNTVPAKRKAAIRARKKIKEDSLTPVFTIEPKCTKIPLHAWDWDTFNMLTMLEPDLTTTFKQTCTGYSESTRSQVSSNEIPEIEEAELSWDDNPEQISIQNQSSQSLKCGSNPNLSFSDQSSHDDEVFIQDNPTKLSSRIKRSGAFRKKKWCDNQSNSNGEGMIMSNDPRRSNKNVTNESQHQNVRNNLNKLTPMTPSNVLLDGHVQNVQHPLAVIQGSLPSPNRGVVHNNHRSAEVLSRRSKRLAFNYADYHRTGSKIVHGSANDTDPSSKQGKKDSKGKTKR